MKRIGKKVAHLMKFVRQPKLACGISLFALFISILSATAFAATPTGAMLTSGPLNFPSGFMTSITSYGAVGDGVTDDTASIQ